MSSEDLRGWDYYRTGVRSLRIVAGAFLLALAATGLMALEVQVQVVGRIAAALLFILVIAFIFTMPLFLRASKINADAARERGGYQIDGSTTLLRMIISDAFKGFRN
ncbi:hypothetical protein ACIBSW_31235 [Actinoplanes sp. NPDC049668]|uniref:hypothetical protein n=1 Tax=unclassified Actinoplanes TaxID=2626549 RepID=UPI0033AD5B16